MMPFLWPPLNSKGTNSIFVSNMVTGLVKIH
jgi:hypothetical protein